MYAAIYYPEGVDMDRVDPPVPTAEAYLPDVPDPLDITSPTTEDQAAARVATYLYRAKGDPGTAHLQWHACQTQIYPWALTLDAFTRLVEDLPADYPTFEHELARDVWFSDVAVTLTRTEADA